MITDVEVIDDAFDDYFIEHFEVYFSSVNWKYGQYSVNADQEETTRFFLGTNFDDYIIDDCPVTEYIKSVAEKSFDIQVKDYEDLYLNGHTFQLDGEPHVDQHIRDVQLQKFTLMYMPNFKNYETLGGFEFAYNTLIDYKPGRLILFPSNITHRGLSTSSKSNMRMTLVWKNCTIARHNA